MAKYNEDISAYMAYVDYIEKGYWLDLDDKISEIEYFGFSSLSSGSILTSGFNFIGSPAFLEISRVTGIVFSYTNNPSPWENVNIEFSFDHVDGGDGYFYPRDYNNQGWSNSDIVFNGTPTYKTLIHETLHAFGLGHTGDYNGEIGVNNSVFDNFHLSMMDYKNLNYPQSITIPPADAEVLWRKVGYAPQYIDHKSQRHDFDGVFGHNNIIDTIGYDVLVVGDADWGRSIGGFEGDPGHDIDIRLGGLCVLRYSYFRGSIFPENFETYVTIMDRVVINGDPNFQGNFSGTFIEAVESGSGDDIIQANSLSNTIWAGAGNDTVYGDGGSDNIYGGAGHDLLYATSPDEGVFQVTDVPNIFGEDGDDTLYGGEGVNFLFGGGDNDTIWGKDNTDYIEGGTGKDVAHGLGGNDTIHGGTGDDVLWGGADADSLFGEGDHDEVYGGGGNDTLRGGDGNDWLYGGADNDELRGDDHNIGNDVLDGGTGNDTLIGGGGMDVFVFRPGDGWDIIMDFEVGVDRIRVSMSPFNPTIALEQGMLVVVSGNTKMVLQSQYYSPEALSGLETLLFEAW